MIEADSLDQVKGRVVYPLVSSEYRDAFRDSVRDVFKGESRSLEFRMVGLKGRPLWLYTHAVPLRDDKGDIVFALATTIDITERRRAEEELRRTEEQLSRAQAISHVGDWEWDIATDAVHWSDELYRIYGFEPRSVRPDYGLVLAHMHPESKEKFLKAIDAALNEDRHFEMDYRFFRKDGSDAVLHTIGKVVRDTSGAAVRMLGVVQEITERKKADERIKAALNEKETLLRELYHRTKNNMQVITSLLNLQSHAIEDVRILQIIEDTKSRIHSMALVHEKLYKAKDLSQVNMSDYITDLARSLMDIHQIGKGRISLILDIDNIPLSIDAITPCGLVINELITNTLKYAFPDDRDGKITISAHIDGERMIELRYQDDGIGLPGGIDLKEPKSLGLKIVRSLVETQLKGGLEADNGRGAGFVIRFKEIQKRTRN